MNLAMTSGPLNRAWVNKGLQRFSNMDEYTNEALHKAVGGISWDILSRCWSEDDEIEAKNTLHSITIEIAILATKRKLSDETFVKLRREAVEAYHGSKIFWDIKKPDAVVALASMTEPCLTEDDVRVLERCFECSATYDGPLVHRNGFMISRSLLTTVSNAKRWLVEGIIPRTGVMMLYGETGIGKSYAAIDLAFAVTAGSDWAGRETSPFEVLYIPTEDAFGIYQRNALIARQKELPEDCKPLIANCNFDLSRNSESVMRLIENLRDVPGPIGLVIIDTMQMALGGADENSATEATAIVENCRRLSLYLDCAVLLVHHSGKDGTKKARGSSAFMAAMDTVIHMTKSKSGMALNVVKQKNGPGGLTCTGKLLPTDDGDGCYLHLDDWSDGVSEPRTASKAPLSEIVLGLVTGYCDLNQCRSLSRNEVTGMIKQLPDWNDKNSDSVRKASQRVIKQLVEDKYLSADLTTVYLIETKPTH